VVVDYEQSVITAVMMLLQETGKKAYIEDLSKQLTMLEVCPSSNILRSTRTGKKHRA